MSARSPSATLSKSPFAAALLGVKPEPQSPTKEGWNKFIKEAIDETKEGEWLAQVLWVGQGL